MWSRDTKAKGTTIGYVNTISFLSRGREEDKRKMRKTFDMFLEDMNQCDHKSG